MSILAVHLLTNGIFLCLCCVVLYVCVLRERRKIVPEQEGGRKHICFGLTYVIPCIHLEIQRENYLREGKGLLIEFIHKIKNIYVQLC